MEFSRYTLTVWWDYIIVPKASFVHTTYLSERSLLALQFVNSNELIFCWLPILYDVVLCSPFCQWPVFTDWTHIYIQFYWRLKELLPFARIKHIRETHGEARGLDVRPKMPAMLGRCSHRPSSARNMVAVVCGPFVAHWTLTLKWAKLCAVLACGAASRRLAQIHPTNQYLYPLWR